MIEDFKANKLQRMYSQRERPSLLNLPIPRRDLFVKGTYYFRNTISTTRGCPYACSFCPVTSFFGHTYRSRPVEEILKEIETFNERKFIIFVDGVRPVPSLEDVKSTRDMGFALKGHFSLCLVLALTLWLSMAQQ